MKEHNKTSEKEQNKIERSNQTNTEFKTLVIWVCNEFRRKVGEHSENFNKEIEIITIEIENIKKELLIHK